MAAPPPYDKAQEAGGFQPPPPPTQGMGHMQAPQTFGQHITMFYRDPVTTVCPNCRASITTSVAVETGTVAWISAGILCAIGLCLCAPIPLCLGSMKDAIHRCPNCNAVVGRYKAKF